MDNMDDRDDSIVSEELSPPNKNSTLDFNKSKFVLDFEKLIYLIRAFIFMCIFYMVLWMFRDRNKDIKTLSYTFTLYNSIICSILSIYYYFTGSVYVALFIAASLFGYMLADNYYGFIHYHSLMCNLNGYMHHFVYILFFLYFMYYDHINIIASYILCEIATLCLNIKYVFRSDSFLLHLIILLAFILFRVFYWGFITYKNVDIAIAYKTMGIMSVGALFLHTYWTYIHGIKLWKKYIFPFIVGKK
jgi:hypothetical protein